MYCSTTTTTFFILLSLFSYTYMWPVLQLNTKGIMNKSSRYRVPPLVIEQGLQ